MSNTKPCGTCNNYWALEQGLRSGKRRMLTQGYCLERSVFAKNKPGNPVYPPRAKVGDLENAVHKLVIVSANDLKKHCNTYKERID